METYYIDNQYISILEFEKIFNSNAIVSLGENAKNPL